MKKVFLSLALVTLISIFSVFLAGEIFGSFEVTIATALFVSALISTSLAIVAYENLFRETTAESQYRMYAMAHCAKQKHDKEYSDGNVSVPILSDHTVRYTGETVKSVHVAKGIIKKGDTLSLEHRAKISASLKKRNAEKKAQEARIAEAHSRSLSRKKSGK